MRIEQLGAHLKAYVDALPAISTLRLCNRFGTGDACHVNRLPDELVELIEEHIIEVEREEALKIYSKALRCCEDSCEPLDHFTQEELYDAYHSYFGCLGGKCDRANLHYRRNHVMCEHGACDGDKCPAWKYDRDLDLEVVKQLKQRSGFDEREERCWACQELLTGLPIAEEQHELLKTHFGISVLTKVWRPKGTSATNRSFTHAAYLTLPDNIIRVEEWEHADVFDYIGFGMPVDIHTPPTEKLLSRFPRAFKILGLQAWSHPGFKDQPILSPPATGEGETVIDGIYVVQARLTFLVDTG